MQVELESAVKFIISMLRAGHRAKMVRSKGEKFFLEPEIEMLHMSLLTVMSRQYKDFWFPESPNRGSAYRCIRINKDKMDPIIAKAAASCGLSCHRIRSYLPEELTMWVDPAEVSYRIGEEDGSICVLYEAPLAVATAAATAALHHQPGARYQPPLFVSSSSASSSCASSLTASVSTSPGSLCASPPFNNSNNHHNGLHHQHHYQQQQHQQQHQQQQQQHQLLHQAALQQHADNNGGAYSNYTSPIKPTNVIAFVPPTYGSPVQFVHSPYQSYPTYISS